MAQPKIKTVFSNPIVKAAEAAALFFVCYVFFSIMVIFLVQGSGHAPWITRIFLEIVGVIGTVLGYRPHESPVYAVGFLFSSVIFFCVLVITALKSKSSD